MTRKKEKMTDDPKTRENDEASPEGEAPGIDPEMNLPHETERSAEPSEDDEGSPIAEELDDGGNETFDDLEEPDSESWEGEDSGNGEATELESALAELQRLRDQHLRLAADFENFRKRANAEVTGIWVRARADLVRSLVEGLDDLQRVSQFTSDDTTVEALIEGVDLVERNILKALKEAGLEVLWPEGQRFDPNRMEAMMRVPVVEEGQDEMVHQVFQKGYMFKDQLVRPARVSVYKEED